MEAEDRKIPKTNAYRLPRFAEIPDISSAQSQSQVDLSTFNQSGF